MADTDPGTGDDGNKPDDTDKPDPAKPAAPATGDATDQLGASGKAALAAERADRRAAEKALKDAQARIDELSTATQTADEKAKAAAARAVAEAKAEVRKEVLAEANARLLKSEIRAAAAGVLADPGDAVNLLGDLERFTDESGEPNEKAIKSAIDKLVRDKPYLAAAGTRTSPLPGGGAKPASGFSMNDEIRQMAGRG